MCIHRRHPLRCVVVTLIQCLQYFYYYTPLPLNLANIYYYTPLPLNLANNTQQQATSNKHVSVPFWPLHLPNASA